MEPNGRFSRRYCVQSFSFELHAEIEAYLAWQCVNAASYSFSSGALIFKIEGCVWVEDALLFINFIRTNPRISKWEHLRHKHKHEHKRNKRGSFFLGLCYASCRSANASEIRINICILIRHLDCSWGKLVSRNFVYTSSAYFLILWCSHLLLNFVYLCLSLCVSEASVYPFVLSHLPHGS